MAFPIEIFDNDAARTALKQVFERAATDAEFRERALAEPMAVLEDVAGKRLGPNTPEIQFQEDGPTDLTLTIPALYQDGDELSEEALEQVAGGNSGRSGSDDEWSG